MRIVFGTVANILPCTRLTIEEALRDQLNGLMTDLLAQKAGVLSSAGISKHNRRYWKKRQLNQTTKLPPTEAVLAALILLRREIIVEGVSGLGGGKPRRYAIVALELEDGLAVHHEPAQMSLLAGLDFSPEAEATIERAERKGPNRVELELSIRRRA